MHDDKLTQLIFSHQLVSVMNRTKWRELADAMTSNEAFNPTVRVSYVDGYKPAGFSHLDWEWVRRGDARIIKWIEIDPVRRSYVGRLVKQQAMDFSDWVRECLLQHSIPFVESEGIFRVNGYLQPA